MKYLEVYNAIRDLCIKQREEQGKVSGFTAEEVAKLLNMKRPNVVREFGRLTKEGLLEKKDGRPVYYYVKEESQKEVSGIVNERNLNIEQSIFDSVVGNESSLKQQISLAKAAIVYPPRGLHSLIVGETGVGKSYFAKIMFKYALQVNVVKDSNGFAVFNCADYANTPQLLVSQIFGVKKGAFTGAVEDREGIIEKARNGILFLDEVHRLPPEGQEMLFTLIDEGKYSPLGSTKEIAIEVMIICATTENINSSLLRTFTRRIPVTISLPPLRERTVEDRLKLIQSFFEEESKRVGKKIEVDGDAITALINYDCFNNIGELKSDIQIACAKAFLKTMFSHTKIKINLEDFSDKVKAGLLKANKITSRSYKLKIDNKEEVMLEDIGDKYNLSTNIYEFIESRSEYLKSYGLEKEEVKQKVSNEVEKFINKYLASIKDTHVLNEIKCIVNSSLYDFLSNFIYVAEYRLKRKISKNIFMGLLIHIDTFLSRARANRIIENPKIDEVRKKYPEEFKLAMVLADKLEEKYKVAVPMDEIGFITMFFAADGNGTKGKVTVIVAMHGNSTATSMAEVVNQLLNTNHAIGFDMPLTMKPETALQNIENIIKERNEGLGALLLVDMGSLKFFDKIIKNNTGIEVNTVDMVTTVMVIEAIRKAIMNQPLDEIVKSLGGYNKYLGNNLDENVKSKKQVIITACFTGEGTAQKLKDIIYKKFNEERYEVINLGIKDRDEFKKAVENIQKETNVLAIVSPFNIKIQGIDYIPMDKFFKEFLDEDFDSYISDEGLLENMKTIYREYLDLHEAEYIVNNFIELISTIKYTFDIHLDSEKLNGLLMHFGSLIQKLLVREDTYKCRNLEIILSRHSDLFNYLKSGLKELEHEIDVSFSHEDIGNIIEILINL
jgi:transcriptional regulatory protein LevR/transcriptional regulator with AAA-type ATPase domain